MLNTCINKYIDIPVYCYISTTNILHKVLLFREQITSKVLKPCPQYNPYHFHFFGELSKTSITNLLQLLQIVDSIMALFRVDFSGRGELADRQQKLAQMLSRLQKISEGYRYSLNCLKFQWQYYFSLCLNVA